MNNQMHGLCTECISHFTYSIEINTSDSCTRCNESQAQFIVNNSVICLKCYLKEKDSTPRKSQLKTSVMTSSVTLMSKNQLVASSFLAKTGRVVKKIQKILTQNDKKTNQIIQYLSKKSILANNLTWEKVVEKCSKTSSVVYFFVGKQFIFGAFHTQSIKIGQNSFIEDLESGLFMTKRTESQINFYKTTKNVVRYSQKMKSVSFGDPPAFEMSLANKELTIKTEFTNLKWDQIFVYKI